MKRSFVVLAMCIVSLAAHAAAPTTVRYEGLTLALPGAWVVEELKACLGNEPCTMARLGSAKVAIYRPRSFKGSATSALEAWGDRTLGEASVSKVPPVRVPASVPLLQQLRIVSAQGETGPLKLYGIERERRLQVVMVFGRFEGVSAKVDLALRQAKVGGGKGLETKNAGQAPEYVESSPGGPLDEEGAVSQGEDFGRAQKEAPAAAEAEPVSGPRVTWHRAITDRLMSDLDYASTPAGERFVLLRKNGYDTYWALLNSVHRVDPERLTPLPWLHSDFAAMGGLSHSGFQKLESDPEGNLFVTVSGTGTNTTGNVHAVLPPGGDWQVLRAVVGGDSKLFPSLTGEPWLVSSVRGRPAQLGYFTRAGAGFEFHPVETSSPWPFTEFRGGAGDASGGLLFLSGEHLWRIDRSGAATALWKVKAGKGGRITHPAAMPNGDVWFGVSTQIDVGITYAVQGTKLISTVAGEVTGRYGMIRVRFENGAPVATWFDTTPLAQQLGLRELDFSQLKYDPATGGLIGNELSEGILFAIDPGK